MSCGNRGEDSSVTDSDRTTTHGAKEAFPEEEMRPLPNGGLEGGMPEWLRRPPAWRNLSREGPWEGPSLPEPDTSVIDPRTLVDVADLPHWLQEIAARHRETTDITEPVMTEQINGDGAMQTNDQNNSDTPNTTERQVPFEPVDKKKWAIPEKETKIYGGGPPKGSNTTMLLAVGIVALIVILIILFVLL
jgi:hypothetical protein